MTLLSIVAHKVVLKKLVNLSRLRSWSFNKYRPRKRNHPKKSRRIPRKRRAKRVIKKMMTIMKMMTLSTRYENQEFVMWVNKAKIDVDNIFCAFK
jgi:hypothetical protein|tara:strand:- start:10 stop:294 length:285 start_codon:yes stop_codon:yes gene_type:complete